MVAVREGADALPSRPMTAAPTLRRPPGPLPNNGGVLGSLRFVYGALTDPIGFVRRRFEQYGDIYFVPSRTGDDAGLFVLRHPEHIREVLVTRASSFTKQHSAFRQLTQFLGEGLLTADGDTWKRQRRMVQPAFSPTRMAGYLAGHETTSNVLTWTFALLAKNPDVDAKLAAELAEVLTSDGRARAATFEDLPRLTYTERVLAESMRLYPPAYVVARKAHEDTEIGGYAVPRGAEVMVWIYLTHHDPRWFPAPDDFRPDRFEPGAEAQLPRSAYLPFGAGPRACIGKSFAMMEAKILLATLARKFRFELAPAHKLPMKPQITLTPRDAMMGVLRGR